MARRRYTDEQRAEAVALLQANGYPDKEGALARTSRALDIPESTIRGWNTEQHNPPPANIRESKKKELRDSIRDEMDDILKRMGTQREKASYRDLGTVFGILADKMIALQNNGAQKVDLVIHDTRERLNTRLTDLIDARTGDVIHQ